MAGRRKLEVGVRLLAPAQKVVVDVAPAWYVPTAGARVKTIESCGSLDFAGSLQPHLISLSVLLSRQPCSPSNPLT